MHLLALPDCLLLNISSFCQHSDHLRLRLTCRRLQYVLLDNEKIWNKLCSSQISSWVSFCSMPPLLRFYAGSKWTRSSSKPKRFALVNSGPKNSMARIRRNDCSLFVSARKDIVRYRIRRYDGGVMVGKEDCVTSARAASRMTSFADVDSMAVAERAVICGMRNGAISCFSYSDDSLSLTASTSSCHASDVHGICFTDFETVCSGSKDKSVRIWRLTNSGIVIHKETIMVNDRVWSIASSSSKLCVGTAGCVTNSPSLLVYDIESGFRIFSARPDARLGAGFLEMQISSNENELLVGGYDSKVRLFDLRSFRNERTWMDPNDNSVFSFTYDDNNLIASGHSRFGQVLLFDRRCTGLVNQFWASKRNEPVYSVAFTPTQIYAAVDGSITVLSILPTEGLPE